MTLPWVLAISLAAVALLMTVTALVSRRVGRVAVVDVIWGLGFVVVALVCAVVGDEPVRWLLLGMVGVWGLRLTWHLAPRQIGPEAEEDPRYAEMLGEGGFFEAVKRVFVVQGLAMWFVSLPVQVAAVVGTRWTWLVWVGVAVWAVGLVFESVGDAQMKAYKSKPKEERAPVMDQGLWGWTRHPNYFGDSSVWWGIWLVGGLAGGLLPALTIVSPIAMTYFLVFATGARLLERSMMKRDGYPEYAERTSFFFPLPPKKHPVS